MRNETCRCVALGCREEIELSDRSDLRGKGWGAIPNTSQGLVFEYLCPKHLEALNPILDSLSSLFGLRAGSLGFNVLFRARYAAMRPKREDGTVVFTFQRVTFNRENRRENGEIFSVRGAKTTSDPEDREGRHFTKEEGKEFLRFGPTRSCHVPVASEVEFVYRPPFDGPYMRVEMVGSPVVRNNAWTPSNDSWFRPGDVLTFKDGENLVFCGWSRVPLSPEKEV